MFNGIARRAKALKKLLEDARPLCGQLQRATGRSRLSLLWDIRMCSHKYKTSLEDYILFSFHLLSHDGRRRYVGDYNIENFRAKLNDPAFTSHFTDKQKFLSTFGEFVGRRWLYAPDHTPEEILAFIGELGVVFVKPVDATQGKGAFKISLDEITEPGKFCSGAIENRLLLEELIHQHPVLAAVNPHSVNSLRINTVLDKSGELRFINAVLRCASDESVVDNYTAGGIVTSVDLETGVLLSDSEGKSGSRFIVHPYSGVILPGLQIPYWRETRSMLERAALTVPQVRLVGWDVAITGSGPLLVEGNDESGPHTMQKNGGVLEILEKYV